MIFGGSSSPSATSFSPMRIFGSSAMTRISAQSAITQPPAIA